MQSVRKCVCVGVDAAGESQCTIFCGTIGLYRQLSANPLRQPLPSPECVVASRWWRVIGSAFNPGSATERHSSAFPRCSSKDALRDGARGTGLAHEHMTPRRLSTASCLLSTARRVTRKSLRKQIRSSTRIDTRHSRRVSRKSATTQQWPALRREPAIACRYTIANRISSCPSKRPP